MDHSGLTISTTSFKSGEYYYYHSLFKESKQPIVFQTSYLRLMKEPSYIQRFKKKTYFFNLSFHNLHQDPVLQTFQQTLISFEMKMNKWINKRYKKKFIWHSSFKDQGDEMIWTLTTKEMDKLVIFDMERHSISLDQLHEQLYIRLRIHVNYIWFRKDTNIAGIDYRILQIQSNQMQLPTHCLFPSDHVVVLPSSSSTDHQSLLVKKNNHPVSEHPLFSKYFKMLTMGIPKEAIKQKMEMNKLPIEIIDLSPEEELPPQYQQYQQHHQEIDVLSQSINEGVELSKTEPIQKRVVSENKLTITIDDITERLRSLRPTKKENNNNHHAPFHKKQNLISILSQKLSFIQGQTK